MKKPDGQYSCLLWCLKGTQAGQRFKKVDLQRIASVAGLRGARRFKATFDQALTDGHIAYTAGSGFEVVRPPTEEEIQQAEFWIPDATAPRLEDPYGAFIGILGGHVAKTRVSKRLLWKESHDAGINDVQFSKAMTKALVEGKLVWQAGKGYYIGECDQ